jgi:hypothetical protein
MLAKPVFAPGSPSIEADALFELPFQLARALGRDRVVLLARELSIHSRRQPVRGRLCQRNVGTARLCAAVPAVPHWAIKA